MNADCFAISVNNRMLLSKIVYSLKFNIKQIMKFFEMKTYIGALAIFGRRKLWISDVR